MPLPSAPLRSVTCAGKNTDIEKRKIRQRVRDGVTVAMPVTAMEPFEISPGLTEPAIRAMHLCDDRKFLLACRGGEQLDRLPILHPTICIQPNVKIVSREVTWQEWPCRHRSKGGWRWFAEMRDRIVPLRLDYDGAVA